MKIASLNPVPLSHTFSADDLSRYLRGKRLNFLLVRAEAEDGTVGYGEVCDSFCCNYPLSVSAVIDEAIAPLVIGNDFGDVAEVIQEVRRNTRRRLGDGGLPVQALSGVEIALWDLKGKLAGKPVCELLGALRREIPVYASGSFLDEGDARWHVQYFEPMLRRGVRAIKVRLGMNYEPQLHTLRELRAAVGDDVRILVDGNEFFALDQAVAIARTLADLNVFFFEEPLPQCEREDVAALVQRSAVPIAYGEHLFLVHDFEDCIRNRRADYLQPDASICGGISEGVRIGKISNENRVRIAPHSAAGPVSLAANLHMAAAMNDVESFEYSFPLCPMWSDTAHFSLDDIHDGHITVPQGIGLGVRLRDNLISESRRQQVATV